MTAPASAMANPAPAPGFPITVLCHGQGARRQDIASGFQYRAQGKSRLQNPFTVIRAMGTTRMLAVFPADFPQCLKNIRPDSLIHGSCQKTPAAENGFPV